MFKSTSTFDRLLERATSHLLLEPDWNAILAICDTIRSGDVPPKYAVSAIKKKFYHDNPHVVIYSLQVIESCCKNCGHLIHDEVATKEFMDDLRELVKHTTDENTRKKILEILQTWGMAFRNSPKYRIVTDTLNLMKAEGWKFPPVREAEAMFEADTAPDWEEGDVCHRCRVAFGMITRQHHCRACGQVFCGKCSSRSCTVPKFGLEKEVRVCDSCFEKFGPKEGEDGAGLTTSPIKSTKTDMLDSDLPAEYLASPLSQQPQAPTPKSGKSEEELKEEEELQLAIALSQSEAQAKEEQKKRTTSNSTVAGPKAASSSLASLEPKQSGTLQTSQTSDEISPELMRYLDRDYWEKKEKEKSDLKAKALSDSSLTSVTASKITEQTSKQLSTESSNTGIASMNMPSLQHPQIHQNLPPALQGGANNEELDEFVTTLKTQVEIFVNRMKSNSSRGRSITNDSSVQTLFMNTMAMHSKLLKHIQDQEDKRVYYEGLQDKLTQVKDARAALDALREEERERKRREAEEAERIRQIQMREKLEVMRKKKQEYLQYQRQIALQRMQEQEMEMKLRQEQVKQQYAMNVQQNLTFPPNMYGQPMAPQPGIYQGMQHPQNQGMLPTQQHTAPYIPQYNPAMAGPQGQHPMQYQPGQQIPVQQPQSTIASQATQMPPGQPGSGPPVTTADNLSTTMASGMDPQQALSMQQGTVNPIPTQSQVHGNLQPMPTGHVPPNSGDSSIQRTATFNMGNMASALPQQVPLSNPYHPHQQQSLQLSQGQTGVPLPTFAHPEMQQGIPQQGIPGVAQPQQMSSNSPGNVAQNVPQQATAPQSLISFD